MFHFNYVCLFLIEGFCSCTSNFVLITQGASNLVGHICMSVCLSSNMLLSAINKKKITFPVFISSSGLPAFAADSSSVYSTPAGLHQSCWVQMIVTQVNSFPACIPLAITTTRKLRSSRVHISVRVWSLAVLILGSNVNLKIIAYKTFNMTFTTKGHIKGSGSSHRPYLVHQNYLVGKAGQKKDMQQERRLQKWTLNECYVEQTKKGFKTLVDVLKKTKWTLSYSRLRTVNITFAFLTKGEVPCEAYADIKFSDHNYNCLTFRRGLLFYNDRD